MSARRKWREAFLKYGDHEEWCGYECSCGFKQLCEEAEHEVQAELEAEEGFVRRTIPVVALLLFLTGCTTTNYRVASLANDYDYLEARYERVCKEGSLRISLGACINAHNALAEYYAVTQSSVAAVKRGGDQKLAVAAMKAARAAAAKELK